MERQLIEHAESLVPPKDAFDDARRSGLGTYFGVPASLPGQSGARWWWDSFDETLTPFALTGAAVSYYVERVRTFGAGPNPWAKLESGYEHNARVSYIARVTRPSANPEHHEVRLDLEFDLGCGWRCGLSFNQSRIVEFDNTGKLVRVSGDGPADIRIR